jgi:hypothetical protein
LSKRLPPVLTDELFRLLNGAQLDDHLNQVILLITLDERGWPYVAILSYLEIVAPDRENIRLAPWNNSTTTANLRRNPNVTLVIVEAGMACYIQGTAVEIERAMPGFASMAKINVKIVSILEDKALDYEGSASISTGVRFENPQMDRAYIERGRKVLESLRR